jgi:hypothetical protein
MPRKPDTADVGMTRADLRPSGPMAPGRHRQLHLSNVGHCHSGRSASLSHVEDDKRDIILLLLRRISLPDAYLSEQFLQ